MDFGRFIPKRTRPKLLFIFYRGRRTNPLRVLTVCPPKRFAFWYRTAHHSPTKQSTGLFCLTVRALSGFESILINKKIKSSKSYSLFFTGVEGLEPSRTVLETGMLPLHHTPKYLICNIAIIY